MIERRLKHDKLIPAHADRKVARACKVPQSFPDRRQEFIANGMAEAVIDGLEAVKIEAMNTGQQTIVASQSLKRLGQCNPVAEPGERVAARLKLDFQSQRNLPFGHAIDMPNALHGRADENRENRRQDQVRRVALKSHQDCWRHGRDDNRRGGNIGSNGDSAGNACAISVEERRRQNLHGKVAIVEHQRTEPANGRGENERVKPVNAFPSDGLYHRSLLPRIEALVGTHDENLGDRHRGANAHGQQDLEVSDTAIGKQAKDGDGQTHHHRGHDGVGKFRHQDLENIIRLSRRHV